MRTTLHVCLLAGAMAFCLAKAAASPVTGTWEGEDGGVKAVTLKIVDSGGKIRVDSVFYIVHDEGSGKHVGAASEAPSAEGTWNGRQLKFTVVNTAGARIAFEMTVTGDGKAELRRLPSDGMPELVVPLFRRK